MKELARGPRLSNGELDDRLRDFRDNRVGILLCIIFTMTNRECSLAEAREIVINSIAWIDQRDAFLQEQEAVLEEFIERHVDRIESIQQTMSPDGTQATVHMKSRD